MATKRSKKSSDSASTAQQPRTARKRKHHQRDEKFEVVYPIDSDNAWVHAIGRDGAEEFRAAAEGDQMAVKSAIHAAIMELAVHRDSVIEGDRGRIWWLSPSLCDWLLRGFEAAARGQSMEVAMGLRRRGARNTWSLAEKKRAVALLWSVRDYLKTRPSLQGQHYHEVTARWFSDPVVPEELAGFADARPSTSWVAWPNGRLPFKTISADALEEWERQAIPVRVTPR